MKTARWEIRLTPEELDKWKALAAREGKLLSEWIRDRCRAEEPSSGEAEVKSDSPSAETPTAPTKKTSSNSRVAGRGVRASGACQHGADPKFCRFEKCRRQK